MVSYFTCYQVKFSANNCTWHFLFLISILDLTSFLVKFYANNYAWHCSFLICKLGFIFVFHIGVFRIPSEDEESQLLKGRKKCSGSFWGSPGYGCYYVWLAKLPLKHCQLETSSVNGEESSTHTVTASFETAQRWAEK